MKKTTVFLVLLLTTTFLSAQSLVELAKKEKERREAIQTKGKKGTVVTNADLYRTRSQTKIPEKTPRSVQQNRPLPKQKPAAKTEIRVISDQADSQQTDQSDAYMRNPKYASKVLSSTRMVENSDFSLNKPDGRYADISMMGLLDIEINAANGPGPDIAVYSLLKGAKEIESAGEEAGIPLDSVQYEWHEGFWYGVLAMNENREWVMLGRGLGKKSPEEFELGDLKQTNMIRIMFRPHNSPDLAQKFQRLTAKEFSFRIDAIAVLH